MAHAPRRKNNRLLGLCMHWVGELRYLRVLLSESAA